METGIVGAMKFNAFLLVFLIGCTSFTKSDDDAIRKQSKAWVEALAAQDSEKVASMYTKDAVVLPPEMKPVVGRVAIEKHFKGFPKADALSVDITELDGRDDLAVARGSWSLTIGDTTMNGTLTPPS